MNKILLVFWIVIGMLQLSCTEKKGGESNPNITKMKRDICISQNTIYREIMIEGLCNRIEQISKSIPPKAGIPGDDDIYNGMLLIGDDMLPCLVDKITDTRQMIDPVELPGPPTYVAVGDAAVGIIQNIANLNEEEFLSLLPVDVAKKYPSVGRNAYFEYVNSSIVARKTFQLNIRKLLVKKGKIK